MATKQAGRYVPDTEEEEDFRTVFGDEVFQAWQEDEAISALLHRIEES